MCRTYITHSDVYSFYFMHTACLPIASSFSPLALGASKSIVSRSNTPLQMSAVMDKAMEQAKSSTPSENRIVTKESMSDSISNIGQASSKNTGEEPKRRITANVKETGFDSMKYYMKTMGNHELLKKNEEIILAREIQILIKWEEEREALEAKLIRYDFSE
jgi:hypothetical protein